MKKKTMTASLFASVLLLQGPFVFAESSSGSSTATITFETNKNPVILNPENPNEEYKPDPGKGENAPTENTGPLTLDYAPNFNFGAHEILGKTVLFKSTDQKPFLQVTDRRETLTSWKVTAKLDAFESNGKTTLKGASLTIEPGQVKTPSYNSATGVVAPVTTVKSVDLIPEGPAVDILTSTGKSPYSWLLYWPGTDVSPEGEAGKVWSNSNISLTVPLNEQIKGKHVAVINWVLTDSVN